MNEEQLRILGLIIDLMRNEGMKIVTPYDVENFFEDASEHSEMFKTGRFKREDDEE